MQGFGGPVEIIDNDLTSLRSLQGSFTQLAGAVESADVAPTPEQWSALSLKRSTLGKTMAEWKQLMSETLPKLNTQLREAKLAEIDPKGTQ